MQAISSFLAMLPIPAFITARSGRLLFLNDAALRTWMVTKQFAIGKRLSEITELAGIGAKIPREIQALTADDNRRPSVVIEIAEGPHTSTLLIPIEASGGMKLVIGLLVHMHGGDLRRVERGTALGT